MSGSLVWMGLAAGEFLLIIFLALLISWIRHRAMKMRDKKAIKELVAFYRGRKDERVAEISEFLGDKYALEGDEQGYAARTLYKAEAGLIQSFARTYLNRDAKAALNFHKPVQEGVGEYWKLDPGVERGEAAGAEEAEAAEEAEMEAQAPEDQGDQGELDRLRKENQSLSDELSLTMETMGRMLNEYSNVFAKDADLGNIQVIGGEDDLDGQPESAVQETATDEGAESVEQISEAAAEPADGTVDEDTEAVAEDAVTESEPEPATMDVETEMAGGTAEHEMSAEGGVETGAEVVSEAEPEAAIDAEAEVNSELEAEHPQTEASEDAGDVDDIDALLEEAGTAEDEKAETSDEDIDDLIKQLDKD